MNVADVWMSNEWDDLVEETYGRPYCFQQQEGCKERGFELVEVGEWGTASDSYSDKDVDILDPKRSSTVEFSEDADVRGLPSFKTWRETDPTIHDDKLVWYRDFYPDHEILVLDLFRKGKLKEGTHVILIDW